MKKTIKTILTALSVTVLLCIAVFACIYLPRLLTVATIEKITDYKDRYDLYSMTVKYNYSTRDIIEQGLTDTQSYVDAVLKESLPLIPVEINVPSYGCSAFRALTGDGDTIMGRNYDFGRNTSCLMVRCKPGDGYESIAFAALNNISADHASEDFKKKMACLTAPFICLDGINEKGVSIAVLTVDSDPVSQDTGKEKIATSLAIRMVLDYAATTQEAVDLLRGYDMLAINGLDYHFFISDASGDSRAVEYDCEDDARTLIDTPMAAVTNFYARYIDKVEPFKRNGQYGHGKERYNYIMDILDEWDGVLPADTVWEPLKAAATDSRSKGITSNTQWSVIFNNSHPGADIIVRKHWSEYYSFSID